MSMSPKLLCAAVLVGLSAFRSSAQLVTPRDVSDIRLASDVQLSPDKGRVAFAVSEPAESGRTPRRSGIWMAPIDGSEAARRRTSGEDETSPRWSPDGKKLVFLSAHASTAHAAATRQIYRVAADGNEEPERLTSVPEGVEDFTCSPDGRWLAFTAREPVADEDPLLVGRNLRFSRLSILDLADRSTTQVTPRDFDVREIAWSPGGSEVALVVAPTPRPEDDFRLALVVVDRRTGKIARRLSENVAFAGGLRWSPDGRKITFFECPFGRRFGSWLAVVPASGGPVRPILKDRPFTTLRAEWAADSKRLVLLMVEGTGQQIRDFDVETGRWKPMTDLVISQGEFSLSTDGQTIAYLSQSARSPSDVWAKTSGSPPRRLTELNPQTLRFRLGAVRSVDWKNRKDGRIRHGVVVTPPDFEPGHRYPTIVQGHPGDLPWWTGWLATWWAWGQILASRGYVVFLPNYRGVNGEGWRMHATIGDWGGMAFQDLMDGLDSLVARGIADPERLGIGGWSNGGFMTEWTITHTTRFKAAVAQAGHSDFFSLAGTSYNSASLRISFGDPYANRAAYEAHSPITFIRNCRTPTLVIHGVNDLGVPVGQGFEFYSGLKAIGVETEMVVYPGEGHGLRERAHQEDLGNRILDWFDRHLKGPSEAP